MKFDLRVCGRKRAHRENHIELFSVWAEKVLKYANENELLLGIAFFA